MLEAAHVALAAPTADAATRERHEQEALAYLRQAQRDPHQPLRQDIALSLVLALDRAGRRPQADAVLAEQRSAPPAAGPEPERPYLVVAAEQHLFRALASEGHDAAAALRSLPRSGLSGQSVRISSRRWPYLCIAAGWLDLGRPGLQ